MKLCCVCNEKYIPVGIDLCSTCYHKWGNKADWVKALISIDNHQRYLDRKEDAFLKLNERKVDEI